MSNRDDYGYPTTDVLDDGFLAPRHGLEPETSDYDGRHAAAYAAYQERFRVAYMEKVKRRSKDRP